MKRLAYVLVSAAMVATGAIAIGGITGSPHDFSGAGWTGMDEICLPCHVPHNSLTESGASMVLWNHELTTATFAMYGDPTETNFATVRADRDQQSPALGGPSRLCLSCHDGSIALDSYGGDTGVNMIPDVSASGRAVKLGIDLRDDHPIGIQYPANGTTGYHDARDDPAEIAPLKLVNWGSKTNRVECTSCHEPHDNTTAPPFLRMSNTGSLLCLECHDK